MKRNHVLVKEEMKRADAESFGQSVTRFDRPDAGRLLPMVLRSAPIGLVSVGEKRSRDLSTQEDLDFLTAIGGQVAAAVENVGLFSEEVVARSKELSEERESLRKKEERFRFVLENPLGTPAAGVAHDLINILPGIVGYPDLLLMDLPEKSPRRDSVKLLQVWRTGRCYCSGPADPGHAGIRCERGTGQAEKPSVKTPHHR